MARCPRQCSEMARLSTEPMIPKWKKTREPYGTRGLRNTLEVLRTSGAGEEEDRTPDHRTASATLGYSRFLAPVSLITVTSVAISLTDDACNSGAM